VDYLKQMAADFRNAIDGFLGINFRLVRLLSKFNSNIDKKVQKNNQFFCSSELRILHFVGS